MDHWTEGSTPGSDGLPMGWKASSACSSLPGVRTDVPGARTDASGAGRQVRDLGEETPPARSDVVPARTSAFRLSSVPHHLLTAVLEQLDAKSAVAILGGI